MRTLPQASSQGHGGKPVDWESLKDQVISNITYETDDMMDIYPPGMHTMHGLGVQLVFHKS